MDAVAVEAILTDAKINLVFLKSSIAVLRFDTASTDSCPSSCIKINYPEILASASGP